MFRLGNELLVRLPRLPGGSTTIEKEARWLPKIAAGLMTPVPVTVAVGDPGFGYPEKWALTRWIDGHVPDVPWNTSGRGSSRRFAEDLARLITRLRRTDIPPSAVNDPAMTSYRGGRLADLDEDFRESVKECRKIAGLGLDLERALQIWRSALVAERNLEPVTSWVHGDLLAENLLVRDGRLAAVLDFGGLTVGDPSVDLIVAWEVLDPDGRDAFRRALGLNDAAWTKSMGWALLIAMITFPYYWQTMPSRCASRRTMAAAVLATAPLRG